jgi:hypothetical protein
MKLLEGSDEPPLRARLPGPVEALADEKRIAAPEEPAAGKRDRDRRTREQVDRRRAKRTGARPVARTGYLLSIIRL